MKKVNYDKCTIDQSNFRLSGNFNSETTCHLRQKTVEPQGGRKTQGPLYIHSLTICFEILKDIYKFKWNLTVMTIFRSQ